MRWRCPRRLGDRVKRGLFLKYVTLFVGLVTGVLLINAALDLYFVYQDNRRASIEVQREKAQLAAHQLESFVREIENQIGWVAHPQWASLPVDQRRFDYVRLERQVPAIVELTQLDRHGREQLLVSQVDMDAVGSGADRSSDPAFVEAMKNKVYFGPVYFLRESEPHMTIAVAHGGKSGVTVAKVNLKLILDPISQIKVGHEGYAYVVDRLGRLVAHPDISLVLRGTDMSKLTQVAAALAAKPGEEGVPVDGTNRAGLPVLSAHATIPALNWLVFVELPLSEAREPVIATALRALALLVLGLLIAALAAALLARRMVVPIRALQAGAQRIGGGELGHRLDIKTGDELEALANQFHHSAEALQESYATLEQRVEDRTRELSESLEQQTATAEILRVISQSPTDVRPVLDVVVRAARRFCGADDAMIVLREGTEQLLATHQGSLPALVGNRFPLDRSSTTGRATLDGCTIHVPDVADLDPVKDALTLELTRRTNVRALLAAPMLREGMAVGCVLLRKPKPGAFTPRQIELLETFAAQAVIAIENVRLFTELRESLDQQTATSEVLGVINSSPGNVAPIFDAILEKAMLLCDAAFGLFNTFDGKRFHVLSTRGVPEAFAEYRRTHPTEFRPGTSPARLVDGAPYIHTIDAKESEAYKAGDPNRRALVDIGGARSLLVMSLRKDDKLLGMFGLYRQEVRPFTDKQIALLQGFAAQAVIAMENARLLTEQREALEQQTATVDVLRVISQSPADVQPVLTAVVRAAVRFCGAKDALILLRDGDHWIGGAHEGPMDSPLGERHPLTRETAPGRAMIDAKTIHFSDIEELDPVEFATARRMAAKWDFRAAVAAPMLREGGAIGAISLRKPDAGPFTARQIELLEAFAAQAVIAMENARLLTEQREALEQQTATAEVLRVISQSPTDVQPVLRAVAAAARRFCGADDATIVLREGRELLQVAHDGEVALVADARFPFDRSSTIGHSVIDARTIHIPDAASLDPSEYALTQALSKEVGVRALLAAPMLREGSAIGCILLRRPEPGAFTPRQVELLETFASQAVIAIENVRLFTELRESLEQQTATAEMLRVISQSPTDVNPVLKAVARAALRFCGAEDVLIALRDNDDILIEDVAPDGSEPIRRPLTGQLENRRAILDRRTIHHPDVQALDRTEFAENYASAEKFGYRSVVAAPMLREGAAIGSILLSKAEAGPFTPRQIELLEAFATQAVIAFENVRLFSEIQEKGRQLEVASQHKSQFLANMSHELRTPLNAIIGYTEMMADGLYGDVPEKAQGVLERVQSNGRHLLGLINDVLDLSKIEAGQLVLTIEEYSVADMVDTVIAATESLARTKGLALTPTVAPGLPRGHGDARRLSQVLLNLVGNAIKFTDRGGIEIRAVQTGDRFELSVIDSGLGIAPADQARIFDEFQQVDNTSTRKKGGTGLGLSISRRIVELHGGTITVESEVGTGSTFKVTVPINAVPLKEAAQ
jgi:signal transduction histidine kinase